MSNPKLNPSNTFDIIVFTSTCSYVWCLKLQVNAVMCPYNNQQKGETKTDKEGIKIASNKHCLFIEPIKVTQDFDSSYLLITFLCFWWLPFPCTSHSRRWCGMSLNRKVSIKNWSIVKQIFKLTSPEKFINIRKV